MRLFTRGGLTVIAILVMLLVFPQAGCNLLENGDAVEDAVEDAVAIVNGEAISQSQLDLQKQQLIQQELMMQQMQGMEVSEEEEMQMREEVKEPAMDQLIELELLFQHAEEKGVMPGEAEVNEYMQEMVAQAGGEEMVEQQLRQQGMSLEELESELKKGLAVENVIDYHIEKQDLGDEMEVTDAEVEEHYDMQKEMMEGQEGMEGMPEQEMPSLEESRGQIEQELMQQKEQEVMMPVIQQLLENLREQAEIEILI